MHSALIYNQRSFIAVPNLMPYYLYYNLNLSTGGGRGAIRPERSPKYSTSTCLFQTVQPFGVKQQINQRLAYPTPFVRRGYSCFILISHGR